MEKKPEFVVTDRRKFNIDGEPKPDAPPEARAEAPKEAPTQPAEPPKPEAAKPAASETIRASAETAASAGATAAPPREAFVPSPAGETGYNGDHERTAFGGQKMEFVHLLDMLVQTAMMYAGAMETGAERRVDIVGLRQMIDLIGVLEEKTKGNLSEQELEILSNTTFQLRMTYMEIVNMIGRQATKSGPGAPGSGRK